MRNIYMLVGFAAYLPWFVLNWTAFNPNTGQLYAYYSFLFVLSLMWPVVAAVWKQNGRGLKPTTASQVLKVQSLLIVASLFVWNNQEKTLEFQPIYGARWGSYELQTGASNRHLVLEFFAKIRMGQGDLGTVMADDGAITMVRGGQYQGKDLVRLGADKRVDSIIAMVPKTNLMPVQLQKQITKNNLNYKKCIERTTICVFSNRYISI